MMALIVCPECKKNISDMAGACPHCGYPTEGKKSGASSGFSALRGSYPHRLWRGEYPLRYAFWGSFFAVFFSINILIALFPGVLLRMIIPPTAANVVIIIACYLIYAAYLVICAVGVWRSAAGYKGPKPLAVGARVFVCGYLISSLYMTATHLVLPLLYIFRQLG